MTRIIPRRKKHIVPLTVLGIILSVVLSYYTSYIAYLLVWNSDYSCAGCDRSTANSNAKLVFTNFCTYMTKCEENNVTVNDGIYCGSLIYSAAEEKYYGNYYTYALLDGSEDDILKFMRCLMGGSRSGLGYFCMIVKDGKPFQSFWCKDEKLLDYKDYLADLSESIPEEERYDGAAFYTGGAITGGYPTFNIDHKTKPLSGHTSLLPIQTILRDKAEEFVMDLAQIIILFSPLIIMLLTALFIYRHYTPAEYTYNAQAVFKAAEEYVSGCKNTLPDMTYSGVLKARKDEPKICFDGSAEDFSAFLSNIACDRSKNYYIVKIENGKVSGSRFSVSKRFLKEADRAGCFPLKTSE